MSPEKQNSRNHHSIPRRNLPVLVGSTFLIGGAILLFNALLQPLVLFLGGSIQVVGILVSLSSFSRLLPMLISGELSDAVGRRRPMLLASLLMIVAGILFIFATHWLFLIPPILLSGIAFALHMPASIASTAESAPKNQRGRAFAYRGVGRLVAGVIVAILGIAVLQRGNIQNVFFLFIIFVVVNLGLIYFLLTETLLQPHHKSSLFQNIRKNWRIHPKLKSLYLYVVITDSFTYGTGFQILYGLLTEFKGTTSQEILLYTLLINLAAGIVQFGVVGRLVDRTRKWAIVLSDSLAIPTILAFALFQGKSTLLGLFTIMGIATCFWRPAVQAYIVDHVGRERIAAEFGKLWGLKGIVGIFPPIIGGILAATYGYSAPLLVSVGAGVISVFVATFLLSGTSLSSENNF